MPYSIAGVGQYLVPGLGGAGVVAPVAGFTVDVATGTVPFTVTLTNTTTGAGTITYDIDWGDGTAHGSDPDGSHQYTVAGNYTITMTATNAGGSDDATAAITAYREVTLTLQPDGAAGQDNYIYQANATNNNGAATEIFTGIDAMLRPFRGMIKFDLSSIGAGNIIDSATLSFFCTTEVNTTDRNLSAHRALTQWFEGQKDGAPPDASQDGSTWNLRNANGSVAWAGGAGGGSGSDYAAVATATVSITGTGSFFNLNVLADVAAWVAGTATNLGWWLIGDETAGAVTRKVFASSDNATANNRPKLAVTYRTTTPA